MSEAKSDRSVAPAGGTRSSRARGSTRDRNIRPPAPKAERATKPKKGERTMKIALGKKVSSPARDPAVGTAAEATPPLSLASTSLVSAEDASPPADPWWTPERERCFELTLHGIPQHQVAADLQRERHTISRWQDHELFARRLSEENLQRFHAMRQRRTMQTVRLTDKVERIATKMLDAAETDPKDLNTRFAARDWLGEFREQARREDEIYGLDRQHVDVNVHGTVQHSVKGKVDVSFKDFLVGSLRRQGVDLDAEVVDGERADEVLATAAEKALMEGTFLDELVEREKIEALAPIPVTR